MIGVTGATRSAALPNTIRATKPPSAAALQLPASLYRALRPVFFALTCYNSNSRNKEHTMRINVNLFTDTGK